jgi:hypothetical protein
MKTKNKKKRLEKRQKDYVEVPGTKCPGSMKRG